MFEKDEKFVTGRIKSLQFSFRGAYKLITTEHSIIVQLILAIILIVFGIYFKISKTDWLFQILSIGLVLSIEGLNTAVEKVADFVHPDYHEKIGFIKDIAAGAVLFAAFTALAIGITIYLPYFI